MKTSACLFATALLCSTPSLFAEPPTSPALAVPVPAPQVAPATDSDGDGLTDDVDQHPLVPDAPAFSWWVSDVTVGWDLDQSQIDKSGGSTTDEDQSQNKTSYTIGGGLGIGGGGSFGFNADPASVFLSLIPGGNLLKKSGDGFKTQSHLAASFDISKTKERTNTVKQIRSTFQKLEKQRAIKNRHIEFTVEFFNETDAAYQFSNFSIPVQTAARQTRAEAMCYVGGEQIQTFEVPGNRPSGYPVRFRAMLSTTQSEQILDALEAGELVLAIERSNGRATNQNNQIDEIAMRQQTARRIESSTAQLAFQTETNATTWRVARHNPATGAPTTVSEAIDAINAVVATPQNPDYIEISGGVVYAVGSFRNSALNAFEVANTTGAELKIHGWTRLNRYGPDREGDWQHLLEQPLGEGAQFRYMPYEIDRDELARYVGERDPQLASEWLALCHFWLHYTAEHPFFETALSRTSYPLVPLYQHLQPGFAKADFEKIVSDWIKRGTQSDTAQERETARATETQDFREKVQRHRKTILDAAFDGYTEAGAILTRIDQAQRDEIENLAIQAALELGNTDAAAVEAISQLFRDLHSDRQVDFDQLEMPKHVFAQNVLGFLHFSACQRGYSPGDISDAADRALSYSADLGNPFAQAMKGWLLVNIAHYKVSKIINRPNWPEDRDRGMKLLQASVEDSSLAQYVLGDTLYSNRLDVPRDRELAKQYLQSAAERGFGNAAQMLEDKFGE